MKKKYFKWILVALWCIVIFMFSQQNGEASSNNNKFIENILGSLGINLDSILGGNSSYFIRKTAHFTEYFILYLLSYNAFVESVSRKRGLIAAFIFVVLYASSDEIHQSFIPGRGPAVFDVMVDSGGGLLGVAVVSIRNYFKLKNKRYKTVSK